MTTEIVCKHHSGFQSDIDNLKDDVKENKANTESICKKLDAIKTYIMGLFGSLALAIILLLVQLLQ